MQPLVCDKPEKSYYPLLGKGYVNVESRKEYSVTIITPSMHNKVAVEKVIEYNPRGRGTVRFAVVQLLFRINLK